MGPHALGFGLTGVTGVTDGTAFAIDGHTTLRLAYALRLGRSAAIGAAWGHIWSGRFAGTDTFDFGLSVRFGRYAAVGVTVEDAWQPSSTPRLWNAEIAVRPIGTDRFELAIGAAHANADEWRRFVPRARLSATLVDGLRLYAEGARVPVAAGPLALEGGADSRVGVGMALDFGRAGGAVGIYGRFAGMGPDGGSVAGRVHVTGERGPELVGPVYVVRVALEGIDDDRAFVALVRQVRSLAADKPVAAVLFKIENVELGTARIEELRGLMAFLRDHGKRVFAYAPSPSMREYYLAAAADAVVLHPAGELSLTGLSQTVTFYKTAMDRIGVKAELVRIGAYKGAMEPFVMTEQSPDVRANKNRLLDDVFKRMVTTIALDRARVGKRVDVADVRKLIDRGLFTPAEAQAAGLVDGVADQGQLEQLIARALGRSGGRHPRPGNGADRPRRLAGPPRRRRAGRRQHRRRSQPGASVRHRRRRRFGHVARRRWRSAAPIRRWARSSCASTARAAPRSRPTSSRARSSRCARRASRSSCRWATWPRRAATTSPRPPTPYSRRRPP